MESCNLFQVATLSATLWFARGTTLVHPARIRVLNEAAAPRKADYVLYWSQMNRRADANQSLAHAIELANAAGLPVLFYEGLTCSYPWANDRLHTFMLEGVPDSARRLAEMGIGYLFYMRRRQSDPNDVLYRLQPSSRHATTAASRQKSGSRMWRWMPAASYP